MTTQKKYRKKPVTVEASQWWEAGDHDKVGLYFHPPVDPITGGISVADDAIWMGKMRHSEVPERFRRETCDVIMDDTDGLTPLRVDTRSVPGTGSFGESRVSSTPASQTSSPLPTRRQRHDQQPRP